jgi:hypothetical protein
MTKMTKVKFINKEIKRDDEVIFLGDEDNAWGKAISVSPATKPTSIRLSPLTIQRAKFFARIHHERGYQSWLKKIVEERIETEYKLYRRIKKETAS